MTPESPKALGQELLDEVLATLNAPKDPDTKDPGATDDDRNMVNIVYRYQGRKSRGLSPKTEAARKAEAELALRAVTERIRNPPPEPEPEPVPIHTLRAELGEVQYQLQLHKKSRGPAVLALADKKQKLESQIDAWEAEDARKRRG